MKCNKKHFTLFDFSCYLGGDYAVLTVLKYWFVFIRGVVEKRRNMLCFRLFPSDKDILYVCKHDGIISIFRLNDLLKIANTASITQLKWVTAGIEREERTKYYYLRMNKRFVQRGSVFNKTYSYRLLRLWERVSEWWGLRARAEGLNHQSVKRAFDGWIQISYYLLLFVYTHMLHFYILYF